MSHLIFFVESHHCNLTAMPDFTSQIHASKSDLNLFAIVAISTIGQVKNHV